MAWSGINATTASITGGKSLPMVFNRTIDTGATSAAGRWHSLLTTGGTGGPMVLTGTAGTGIALNGSTAGRLPVGPNVSTDLRHLMRFGANTPSTTVTPATLMLVDLIHVYPSCTLTGAVSTLTNHPTWTGTGDTRMTSAAGVQCSLLVTTALTAGSGQITPTYFDQDGNSTAAARSLYAPSATTPAGCFYTDGGAALTLGAPYMPLAAGDYGVQRIVSYVTNVNGTSGVGAFLLYRPIATIPLASTVVPSERAFMGELFTIPRIYDDACLGLMVMIGGAMTTNQVVSGDYLTAWG